MASSRRFQNSVPIKIIIRERRAERAGKIDLFGLVLDEQLEVEQLIADIFGRSLQSDFKVQLSKNPFQNAHRPSGF
jgi:hypothetical protein